MSVCEYHSITLSAHALKSSTPLEPRKVWRMKRAREGWGGRWGRSGEEQDWPTSSDDDDSTMTQKPKKSMPDQVAFLKQTLQMPHRQFGLLPHWRRTFQGTQIILKPCKEHLANQKRSQTSKPKSISHNSPFVSSCHFAKDFHFEFRSSVFLVKNNSAHDIKLNKIDIHSRKVSATPTPLSPPKRYESPPLSHSLVPNGPHIRVLPSTNACDGCQPTVAKTCC